MVNSSHMQTFEWPVRVYYEDTDAGGVVYHAKYLNFFERARTEWLRALGFEQDQLAKELGILFAVRRMEVDYRLPARFNDSLVVHAELVEARRASMLFEQTIRRADNQLLCKAKVQIACLDVASFKPAAIPDVIRDQADHAE